MKINEKTTLGELQIEAGKNGITLITSKIQEGVVLAGLQFNLGSDMRFVVGEGATLHDALDNAFEIVRAETGWRLQREA